MPCNLLVYGWCVVSDDYGELVVCLFVDCLCLLGLRVLQVGWCLLVCLRLFGGYLMLRVAGVGCFGVDVGFGRVFAVWFTLGVCWRGFIWVFMVVLRIYGWLIVGVGCLWAWLGWLLFVLCCV